MKSLQATMHALRAPAHVLSVCVTACAAAQLYSSYVQGFPAAVKALSALRDQRKFHQLLEQKENGPTCKSVHFACTHTGADIHRLSGASHHSIRWSKRLARITTSSILYQRSSMILSSGLGRARPRKKPNRMQQRMLSLFALNGKRRSDSVGNQESRKSENMPSEMRVDIV